MWPAIVQLFYSQPMRAASVPGFFSSRKTLIAALLAAATLVSGCATTSTGHRPPAQVKGGDANTRLMIAEIALQRGDYPAAAEEYYEAARQSASDSLAEQATRVGFENRQLMWAQQSARRWLELAPESAEPRRFLAVIALRLYSVDESVEQFGHVLKTYETPAAGFMDMSATLGTEENIYGIVEVLRGLAAKHSDLAEAHYAVGAAALRAFQYSLAVDSARRALELKPDFADAERLLGRALVVDGQTEEGIKVARARAAKGEDVGDKVEVALLLAAAGDTAGARAEFDKLVDIPEARAEALRTLANIDMSEGKLEDAQRRFTDLLTTGRYVSLAFYSLGAIYERQRDEPKAIRSYARVSGGPYGPEAQLRAAKLLVANGASDQAKAMLDAYVEEHPDSYVDIVIGRARMFADEGDVDAGLQLLADAQRRYPEVDELRYARSILLERNNRVNESIAEIRAILVKRPHDPMALNALGYTLAEHKRNLREAEDMIRRALEKSPNNPAVQDTMGWVLYRLGQHQDALAHLEKAYAVEKDAEIAAHIGEVYWAVGQKTRAREVWQAALASEPNHRYLLKTLRRYPD